MRPKVIETRILFLSLAALAASELAFRVLLAETAYSSLLVLGVARLLEILLLLLILVTWGTGMSSLGLAHGRILSGLEKGLTWAAGFGLCAFVAFLVLHLSHADPLRLIKVPLPPTAPERAVFFVVGALVAPVAEEVFFRGILYGFLRRWGVIVALIGTTFVFVLCHGFSASVPLTQIVGGIVFAVAYEVEGNLMVPITVHVLGNGAIFALSLVQS